MPNTPPPAIESDATQAQDAQPTNTSTDVLIPPTSDLNESNDEFADAVEELPSPDADALLKSTNLPDQQFVPIQQAPEDLNIAADASEEDATADVSSSLFSGNQTDGAPLTIIEATSVIEQQQVVEKQEQQTLATQHDALLNTASLPPMHSEEAKKPVESSTTSAAPVVNGSLLTPTLFARVVGMQQQYTKELSKRFVFNKARKEEKLAAANQLMTESQITAASEAPATGSTQPPTTLNNVIDHVIADHPQAMAGFFSKRFRDVIRAARDEASVVTSESALQSLTESTISA